MDRYFNFEDLRTFNLGQQFPDGYIISSHQKIRNTIIYGNTRKL